MTGKTNSSSTDPGEIRKFGLIALGFFGLLAGIGLWRDRAVVAALFGALALIGLFCLVAPHTAAPLYRGWTAVAKRIGRAVTAAVLTLAYYGVITPAAWIKRLFGGRPIALRPDPDRASYWVDRSEPVQSKERFFKRY